MSGSDEEPLRAFGGVSNRRSLRAFTFGEAGRHSLIARCLPRVSFVSDLIMSRRSRCFVVTGIPRLIKLNNTSDAMGMGGGWAFGMAIVRRPAGEDKRHLSH